MARDLNPCRQSGRPMNMRRTALAIALIVLPASMASPQTPQAPQTVPDRRPPDFRVQIWGDIGGDFSARVWSYAELRSELEKGLPSLRVTDDPVEIWRTVRALGDRIRLARAQAKEGDIFTPPIAAEFKKALRLQASLDTWASLMDDNPGDGQTRINGFYPEREPVSTVPPNILAVLPSLPDDIEYRFMGRDLILLDTRSNLIVDRVHDAFRRPRRDP
jgi:hypothetical protein